ncbi:MAG: type II 3-dehydroquinate dehydratase, partial [Cyanobacteria bacterium P01_F01_bin.42]
MNLLGVREPKVYGHLTLSEINQSLSEMSTLAGYETECFQFNGEGQIIDAIQNAMGNYDGIVINAAAYTHTSIGIRDAIAAA